MAAEIHCVLSKEQRVIKGICLKQCCHNPAHHCLCHSSCYRQGERKMNKSAVITALCESQNKPLIRAHRPQAYSQGSQEVKQHIWKKESPTEVLWTLQLGHFNFSSPLLVWTFRNGKHLYGQILCKSGVQCRRKARQAAALRENSRESATDIAQPCTMSVINYIYCLNYSFT